MLYNSAVLPFTRQQPVWAMKLRQARSHHRGDGEQFHDALLRERELQVDYTPLSFTQIGPPTPPWHLLLLSFYQAFPLLGF
jgi:hypothetical protein